MGILFRVLSFITYVEWLDKVFNFISNDDLENLQRLENKAIEDNNSALMRSYELKMEKYHELHSIYLFSFFIVIELLKMQSYNSFSTQLISKAFDLLYFTGDNGEELFSVLFIGAPSILLILFSLRYISSFKGTKIYNWINGVS